MLIIPQEDLEAKADGWRKMEGEEEKKNLTGREHLPFDKHSAGHAAETLKGKVTWQHLKVKHNPDSQPLSPPHQQPAAISPLLV